VETVGVLVDVRERKEAEQRVLDALEHAQRSADSRANLMQALAHDIRNPLTVIRGFSLTLQQGTVKEPGQQRVLLGRIAAQADSLLRLTTDLLGAARLEETGLRRVPTDLSQVVREAAAAVDTAGRPLAVDAAHVMAEVDAVRVRRIVENLIVNAVRHTPPSTPIWVRLEALDGDVLLTVDDAGTGVPPELREQIFDPFRKGPGSEGTGLGLSLVARFAAEHGGRAWVEERAGGGASFRVLLRRHATNPGG
jgi:signal transduction histidine kinase